MRSELRKYFSAPRYSKQDADNRSEKVKNLLASQILNKLPVNERKYEWGQMIESELSKALDISK